MFTSHCIGFITRPVMFFWGGSCLSVVVNFAQLYLACSGPYLLLWLAENWLLLASVLSSDKVSMGSMCSIEPVIFWLRVLKPINFLGTSFETKVRQFILHFKGFETHQFEIPTAPMYWVLVLIILPQCSCFIFHHRILIDDSRFHAGLHAPKEGFTQSIMI